MGFGFRLAPGVRLRVSSRGVSAGLGPRIARVHVGTRGVGVSSGLGPISGYTSLTSGRGGTYSTGSGWTQTAERQAQREERRRAKEQVLAAARDDVERIDNLHRVHFPPAARYTVPAPAYPSVQVRRRWVRQRYRDLMQTRSRLSLSARAEAKRLAAQQIEFETEQQHQSLLRWQTQAQAWWDQQWSRLMAGERDTVLEVLNDALADNAQPSAVVDYRHGEASVVIWAPPFEQTPTRHPDLTPAGNPTVRTYTKSERNALYRRWLAGHVVVTLKEVFAVAPSVLQVRSVVVRPATTHGYEILLAGVHSRQVIETANYAADGAEEIWQRGTHLRVVTGGRTQELLPLDLGDEPDLRALLGHLQHGAEAAPPAVDDPPKDPEPAVQTVRLRDLIGPLTSLGSRDPGVASVPVDYPGPDLSALARRTGVPMLATGQGMGVSLGMLQPVDGRVRVSAFTIDAGAPPAADVAQDAQHGVTFGYVADGALTRWPQLAHSPSCVGLWWTTDTAGRQLVHILFRPDRFPSA